MTGPGDDGGHSADFLPQKDKVRSRKKAGLEVQKPAAQTDLTDELLMKGYFDLKDFVERENKRFAEYMAPHKDMMASIEQEFLKRLNERGSDSTKSEFGTAYKSALLTVSVSPEGPTYKAIDRDEPMQGRDALLEAALDHWEQWGADMLMIAAQKDAVKKYMEDHEGNPPPGVKTSFFTRVNLRRS